MPLQEALSLCSLLLLSIFIYPVLKLSGTARKWIFTKVWVKVVSPIFAKKFDPLRSKFLRDLEKLVSEDVALRREKRIRVVEVGIGCGANLPFFGRKVDLVAVEPCSDFKQTVMEKVKEFPNIRLECWINNFAEDMKDIPSDYADAIVVSHLLCSVDDVQKSLRECKRILVQGGPIFFMEHVAHSGWKLWAQLMCDPFWAVLTCGCRLGRRTAEEICRAGFSKVLLKTEDLPTTFLINRHIYGNALK